jgi:hypothetical protein
MGAWNSVSAIEPQAVILFLHLTQFIEYFEQSPMMKKKNSSCDSNGLDGLSLFTICSHGIFIDICINKLLITRTTDT